MKKKHFETIIVGGGISGLSCGRRLQDAGKNFMLITEVLGGRTLSSDSFGTTYGADYITEDYKHVLKYVGKKKWFYKLKDYYFFDDKKYTNVYSIKNLKYLPRMIKFFLIGNKVRKSFIKYRKLAPYKSIKECFERDPILLKYWRMSAKEFIKKYRLEYLDKVYGNPVTTATMFAGSDKVNAAYFMGMFLPVVVKTWGADFTNTVKKLTKGYENKIVTGKVTKVKKKGEGYEVRSNKGTFTADSIVLAAPQAHLAKVYPVPKPYMQAEIYTFHIKGVRLKKYQGKKVIFFRKGMELAQIGRMTDGTDKTYSKSAKPDFKKFYKSYKVIKKVHWKPATIIPKKELIEQKLDKNLYLASDYNISSLEDSFLTGLYAANQIIGVKR
ncbi:MAG: NAD(P)-binding protein [Nanoarchaeota archaeon]|nr:NAD(P)-binding protein [Nanoarchaeota archaeon]